MAVPGLCCWVQACSRCSEWGLLSSYSARASHCGDFSCGGARALGMWASVVAAHGLQCTGSVVMAHRLSCSTVFGIFPDQRLNPILLYWQVDSLPLSHQGSPLLASLKVRKQPQRGQWLDEGNLDKNSRASKDPSLPSHSPAASLPMSFSRSRLVLIWKLLSGRCWLDKAVPLVFIFHSDILLLDTHGLHFQC